MDIRHYIDILSRRLWIVIITMVVTIAVVILGTYLQTPTYQASVELRIAISTNTQMNYYDYVFTDRLMNTYVDIATSQSVLTELVKRLKLANPPAVDAEIIPNTELIKVTVEDVDPKLAMTEANTLAEILVTQGSHLYSGGNISSSEILAKQLMIAKNALDVTQQNYQKLLLQTPAAPEDIKIAEQSMNLQQNTYANLLSQYEQASLRETMQANMVTIIEPASEPLSAHKPRKLLNYALGSFMGLFGGIGLAFLFENVDSTLHGSEEIESVVKMAALAGIPKANNKNLDISRNGASHFAEDFRNLATKVHLINHQSSNRVILVMGAEPQQGKSMIVSNLAYALAECGEKVVAIDCDLRLPKLNKLFHLDNRLGLSDLLRGKAGLRKSMVKTQIKGVTVIPSGSAVDHPTTLFSSTRMVKLIESLSKKFDYVLLDTPAFLSFADTEILVRYATGLILVVRQNHSKRESVQLMSRFLMNHQEKIISLVINQSKDHKNYGYYRYPRKIAIRKNTESSPRRNSSSEGITHITGPIIGKDNKERSYGISSDS